MARLAVYSLATIFAAFCTGLLVGWLLWGRPARAGEKPAATPADPRLEERPVPALVTAGPGQADPVFTAPAPVEQPPPLVPQPAPLFTPAAETTAPRGEDVDTASLALPGLLAARSRNEPPPLTGMSTGLPSTAELEIERLNRANGTEESAATVDQSSGDTPGEPAQRPAAAPGAVRDELTRISGISAEMADALAAEGYPSFAAIAAADEEHLRRALRVNRIRSASGISTWAAQAAELTRQPVLDGPAAAEAVEAEPAEVVPAEVVSEGSTEADAEATDPVAEEAEEAAEPAEEAAESAEDVTDEPVAAAETAAAEVAEASGETAGESAGESDGESDGESHGESHDEQAAAVATARQPDTLFELPPELPTAQRPGTDSGQDPGQDDEGNDIYIENESDISPMAATMAALEARERARAEAEARGELTPEQMVEVGAQEPAGSRRHSAFLTTATADGPNWTKIGPPSSDDELTKVIGIDQAIVEALRAAGVHGYGQLAAVRDDELRQILTEANIEHPPTLPTWSVQAALLQSGDSASAATLASGLMVGRQDA